MVVGPPVGAFWLWSLSLASELMRGAQAPFAHAGNTLLLLLGIAYIAGFLPAFFTGLFYAALPAKWQRAVVALAVGAGVTCMLWWLLGFLLRAPPVPGVGNFVVTSAGAVAAATAAFIARLLLEWSGQHYVRDGGKG